MYVYSDPLTHIPVVVPDKEMEVFRIVTSAMQSGLTVLENDPATYQTGDKVRVTDGPFKGAEGYIKRIKKDRKLVVTISGVVAIATTYIPPELLEKI
jgi:transcription antitermination factor NusG